MRVYIFPTQDSMTFFAENITDDVFATKKRSFFFGSASDVNAEIVKGVFKLIKQS